MKTDAENLKVYRYADFIPNIWCLEVKGEINDAFASESVDIWVEELAVQGAEQKDLTLILNLESAQYINLETKPLFLSFFNRVSTITDKVVIISDSAIYRVWSRCVLVGCQFEVFSVKSINDPVLYDVVADARLEVVW